MVARKNELRRLNSWRCESDSIRLVNILAPPAAGAIRVEEAEGLDKETRILFPNKNEAVSVRRAKTRVVESAKRTNENGPLIQRVCQNREHVIAKSNS